LRAITGALALALGGAAAGTLPTAAATGSVVMSANVLAGIDRLTAVGQPAASTPMTIALGVARPNPVAEQAALHAMYDPAGPLYHQFLDVASFAQRFGVPQQRRDAITSWLRGGGLHVFLVSASGDLVEAGGTASQVNALFATTVRTYHAGGRDFLANDRAPSVPAGLGITTVMGLNTWQHASVPQRTAAPAATARCYPTNFCTGVWTAEQMWSLYDLPAQLTGRGQRIAILGTGDAGSASTPGSVIADLRQYESEHHFPLVPYTVHCVMGGDCGTDTSNAGEWDLDQSASIGMAPSVDHLDYYFAKDLTDSNQAAMIGGWLSDPQGPLQANASFSECEQGPYNAALYAAPGNVDGDGGLHNGPVGPTGHQLGDNLEAYAEPALLSGALMGRTLFSSAGDTGTGCTAVVADGIGPNGIGPEPYPTNPYPAGSRYAVAVGGTVLYRDSTADPYKRGLEYAWPYTGGGSSPFLTAPDYQKNVPNLTGTCVTDENGGTGATGQLCRGVPDVAAMSGDILSNGYAIVSGGADTSSGGTSLSSPLWMGMWARIQQASGSPGGLGFANYTFYAAGKDPVRYGNNFFDVTVGSNGAPCPSGPCIAQKGWDYVSGWGVPDVARFAADVAPKHTVAAPDAVPGGAGQNAGGGTPGPPQTGILNLPNTSAVTSAAGRATLAAVAVAGLLVTAVRRRRSRTSR
jgi:subtilase family serine protease